MGRLPLLFFQTWGSTLRLSIIVQYHPEMSSVKPLVLHAHGTGPNPYKVACVLESLGVPYEVKLWQFGDAPNGVKGEQFLKINQLGVWCRGELHSSRLRQAEQAWSAWQRRTGHCRLRQVELFLGLHPGAIHGTGQLVPPLPFKEER